MRRLMISAAILLLAGCGKQESAESLAARAHLEAAAGKWEAAREYAEKAVKRNSRNVPALVTKALVCERLGKLDPAMDAALQAAKANPESYAAQYTLGRLYSLTPARQRDALDPLYQALRLKPDDRDATVLVAGVLTALGNYREALPYLKKMEKDPRYRNSAVLYGIYGNYYFRERQFTQARGMFGAAYNLAKTDPLAIRNIAVMYDFYARPRNAATVRELYRHYLRLTANQPEYAAEREEIDARLKTIERAANR